MLAKSKYFTTYGVRPFFRFLMGIVSVFFYFVTVTNTYILIRAGHSITYVGWLVAFIAVMIATGFAAVAFTGLGLCLRKRHD